MSFGCPIYDKFTGELQQNSLDAACTMPIHLLWKPYVNHFSKFILSTIYMCSEVPKSAMAAMDDSCINLRRRRLLVGPPSCHTWPALHTSDAAWTYSSWRSSRRRTANRSLILMYMYIHICIILLSKYIYIYICSRYFCIPLSLNKSVALQ